MVIYNIWCKWIECNWIEDGLKCTRNYNVEFQHISYSYDRLSTFCLSKFWVVKVSVCRRYGFPTFCFVDILHCQRFSLLMFRLRFVVTVFGFWCFGLATFWPKNIIIYIYIYMMTNWHFNPYMGHTIRILLAPLLIVSLSGRIFHQTQYILKYCRKQNKKARNITKTKIHEDNSS